VLQSKSCILQNVLTADIARPFLRTQAHYTLLLHLDVLLPLLLVNKGVEADSKDSRGRTPLSWAAEKGHEAVVWLLLGNKGVKPDSNDLYGRTPLWWAARNGHVAVVRLLLDIKDVEPDSKDWKKSDAIIVGCKEWARGCSATTAGQ
jgi:ankyrin repeat protein